MKSFAAFIREPAAAETVPTSEIKPTFSQPVEIKQTSAELRSAPRPVRRRLTFADVFARDGRS